MLINARRITIRLLPEDKVEIVPMQQLKTGDRFILLDGRELVSQKVMVASSDGEETTEGYGTVTVDKV